MARPSAQRSPPTSLLAHTITADEVRAWLRRYRKPHLSDEALADIARTFNSWRWEGEPPRRLRHEPEIIDGDGGWDVEETFKAATALHKAIPGILASWGDLAMLGIHPAHKLNGFREIEALKAALAKALPYLEFPADEYPRTRPRPQSKGWHLIAILAANTLSAALVKAGHEKVGFAPSSTTVGFVHEALVRMGHFPGQTKGARDRISAHLRRWRARFKQKG